VNKRQKIQAYGCLIRVDNFIDKVEAQIIGLLGITEFINSNICRYNTHAPSAWKDVENLIRKESELCDNLEGFFVTLSLAGGTGSGVGKTLPSICNIFKILI
jgi:hypothetical protein